MTGPELKQLRHDLSDAIGQRLSLADMARLCGLKDPERNGKDTVRKWEEGEGPSGPVAALLEIIMEGLNGNSAHEVRQFFKWIIKDRIARLS